MIIIVEGCDLAGKTTAIEKIAKHFNSGFVLKNSFKPKTISDNTELYQAYWNILDMMYENDALHHEELFILDRFYPSQAVYSYLRGQDDMQNLDIKNLDKYCRDLDIRMIYIDTPLKDLNNRYDVKGDEHIDKTMLETIKTRYEVFLGLTRLKVLRLDTRKENWIKKVEEFIK